MKSYPKFRDDDLPAPPPGTKEALLEVFRPETEPKFDDHYEKTKRFRLWLLQPKAQPGAFPSEAGDINTPLGRWVYHCSSEWADRYDQHKIRAELGGTGTKGLFTGVLLTVLGAVGIDGVIEGLEEWLPPVVTLGGRVGFPVGFTSRQKKAERNREIMQEIEAKFYE